VSDKLKTGDVILFRRSCSNSALLDGITCLARHAHAPAFDQMGLIVMKNHVPHVAEVSLSGFHFRRYDARIKRSLSKEIVIRPLQGKLTEAQHAALLAFVHSEQTASIEAQKQTTFMSSLAQSSFSAGARELLGVASTLGSWNSSVDFVWRAYAHTGLLPPPSAEGGEGGGTRVAGGGDILTFISPEQPLAAPAKFGKQVFVRDLV
jgi:hypothetical protein